MGTMQIDTLGTSFTIETNEDIAYLDKLLVHFKRMVTQIESNSEIKDPLKISIISGLMICDELCKERQKLQYTNQTINKQDLVEAEKITMKMINDLNKVIK